MRILPYLVAGFFGARSSLLDLRQYRLPNKYSAIIFLAACMVNGISQAGKNLIVTLTVYLLILLLVRGNLGLGDVKFAGACSGFLSSGLSVIESFLLVTWIFGAVQLVIIRWRHGIWPKKIALGPAIYLATIALLGARWAPSLSQ
jgi:Flp pilus assembly protein protease CpaA